MCAIVAIMIAQTHFSSRRTVLISIGPCAQTTIVIKCNVQFPSALSTYRTISLFRMVTIMCDGQFIFLVFL